MVDVRRLGSSAHTLGFRDTGRGDLRGAERWKKRKRRRKRRKRCAPKKTRIQSGL
jgi:hypothetical protein